MKKTAVGMSLILLACTIAGCSSRAVPLIPSSENSEPPALSSEQIAPSDNSQTAYTANETFKDASPDNFRRDSPFNHGQIENEMFNMVGLCSEIYADMKHENGFFFPTNAEQKNIVDKIANEGYIAISHELNMRNADLLKSAYNIMQDGQQSEFCIYYVDILAQISRASFLHKDGVIYYTCPYIEFDAERNPIYQDTDSVRELDVFFLSDKGYLIYGARGAAFAQFGIGYRVEPLPDENRAIKKKYLDPLVSYKGHNVLVENWNQDNMLQVVNFNDVFDILYESDTGIKPHDVFKASFNQKDYQMMAVPAEEFERVITKYFSVTIKELHEEAVYDETRNIYAWSFVKGGGYSPDFEVVDYKYNSDGSLTIIFDALDLRHGDDRNATNTLTVMPNNDGSFQYISNVIELNPEKHSWIPAYHPFITK